MNTYQSRPKGVTLVGVAHSINDRISEASGERATSSQVMALPPFTPSSQQFPTVVADIKVASCPPGTISSPSPPKPI